MWGAPAPASMMAMMTSHNGDDSSHQGMEERASSWPFFCRFITPAQVERILAASVSSTGRQDPHHHSFSFFYMPGKRTGGFAVKTLGGVSYCPGYM